MHFSFTNTRGQAGLDAPPVTVEVHLSAGLPAFQVVGLGESRSREIRSRVRAALISSHLKWPDFNITVNLTPAERVTPARALTFPLPWGCWLPHSSCRRMPSKAGIHRRARPRWLSQTQPGALAAVLAAARARHTLCLALEGSPQLANVEGSRLIASPDLPLSALH